MTLSSLTPEQTEFVRRVATFDALLAGEGIIYCETCDLFSAAPCDAPPVDHCTECGCPDWRQWNAADVGGYFGVVYGARLWPRDHGGMPLTIPEAASFLPPGGES